MSDTARDYKVIEPASTMGLEELFMDVAEGQPLDGPVVAEGQVGDQSLPIAEAAKMLGITRRSVLRLVQENKLAGAKDGHGQWFLTTASIKRRLQGRESSPVSDSRCEPVEMAEVQVFDGPGVALDQVMLKGLFEKMEALVFRNGYLEAQLAEREQDLLERAEQIKLLMDSQHKPSKWQRFRSWFLGPVAR